MHSQNTDEADVALLQRVISGLEADLRADLSPDHARQRVVGARTMAAVVAGRHPEGLVTGSEVQRSLDQVHRLCNEIGRMVDHGG